MFGLRRNRRPGSQNGGQRVPVQREAQPHPRPQSPNREDRPNHRNAADQAGDIPRGPQEPERGRRLGQHHAHRHHPELDINDRPQEPGRERRHDHHVPRNRARESPTRTQRPFHLQPDPRLPAAGIYPSTPITLSSPDGFGMHLVLLLPPSSQILSTLLADAKKAREPAGDIPAEDVVERAIQNGTLTHVSNGPSGGIWVVAAEKPEVLACLVAEMQGGWEMLGVGTGGSEGMMFLRHPCGFGPEVEEEEEEEEKRAERDRDEQRARESDEDDASDEDNAEDNVDGEDFDFLGDHFRDVLQNLNGERADDVNRGRRHEGRADNNLDRGRQRGRARDEDGIPIPGRHWRNR
ncbi:hypothetical protein MMC07_005153 [Pseudocyphellaria aurata]|nr:hypothetical protein [Pseudocyphellaria aurata]